MAKQTPFWGDSLWSMQGQSAYKTILRLRWWAQWEGLTFSKANSFDSSSAAWTLEMVSVWEDSYDFKYSSRPSILAWLFSFSSFTASIMLCSLASRIWRRLSNSMKMWPYRCWLKLYKTAKKSGWNGAAGWLFSSSLWYSESDVRSCRWVALTQSTLRWLAMVCKTLPILFLWWMIHSIIIYHKREKPDRNRMNM